MHLGVPDHRIWSYSAMAAAAFVLGPTVTVTIGWYVQPTFRDSDMTGVHELILLFVMTLATPALALSFGVLAPSAIAIDRVIRGRMSRRINLLFGPVIAIPTLLAFLAGGAFLNSGPDLGEFVDNFQKPFAVAAAHPGRAVLALAFFAALGVITALGMRHRSATVNR